MTELLNSPDLWIDNFPIPKSDGHKYHRGHALIFAAPELTGATRLASTACSRIGAGLVTVLAFDNADIYRSTLPSDIMVRSGSLDEPKGVTARLGGSGGIIPSHLEAMFNPLAEGVRVFDADAIPGQSDLNCLDQNCILTPHEGEFERTFGKIEGSRIERVRKATELSNSIIVLKGHETIVGHPDGRIVINHHASPWLAKAGTGDVLAGLICGLAAQGMSPFDAACAGVWIHGESGLRLSAGLVASDLEKVVPAILKDLLGAA